MVAHWGSGEGGILLLCHMDTVFPLGTLNSMPYREADGKIFGPGVLDMKAGIVLRLAAMEEILNTGLKRPVTCFALQMKRLAAPRPGNISKNLRKSPRWYWCLKLRCWMGPFVKPGGKAWAHSTCMLSAAHSGGDHEQGRNAIEEMAHNNIHQKMTDY